MKSHPIADLLPPMGDAEYARLRDDVKAHGLHVPIVLYEEKILDGRHRFRACEEVGVAVRVTTYTGTDPAGFVYSHNLAHRHLTKTQLAMVGAKLKAYYAEQAKARQGQRTDIKENSPECVGQARDAAGAAVGVSGKSIDEASTILAKGIPALVAMVQRGEISLNLGKRIARMNKSRQKEVIAMPTRKAMIKACEKSAAVSGGKKSAANRAESPSGDELVPGTTLVKEFLTRLEILASSIDRSGMTPEQYAETFLREFDWSEPLLRRRLAHADKAIRCLATLQVMGHKAKRDAA